MTNSFEKKKGRCLNCGESKVMHNLQLDRQDVTMMNGWLGGV